jgi:hypothetical protein
LLIISKGGVTILARLRFFGGGKQSLGEALRQIPLYHDIDDIFETSKITTVPTVMHLQPPIVGQQLEALALVILSPTNFQPT